MNQQNRLLLVKAHHELEQLLKEEDSITKIRNHKDFNYLVEIILHRQAFQDVAREVGLFDYNKNHDLDKIACSITLGKAATRMLHKQIAAHHKSIEKVQSNIFVLEEKVIDYECSGRTKIDAPQTAFEYITSNGNELEKKLLMPIVKRFGLENNQNHRPLTKIEYQKMVDNLSDEIILNELKKAYHYLKGVIVYEKINHFVNQNNLDL